MAAAQGEVSLTRWVSLFEAKHPSGITAYCSVKHMMVVMMGVEVMGGKVVVMVVEEGGERGGKARWERMRTKRARRRT